MTPELTAAAERLRSIAPYDFCDSADELLVITDWLAEHDPAPITPDALAAMGFEDDRDGDWRLEIGPLTLYVSTSMGLLDLNLESLPWMNLGQLRRLLSVLEEANAS